MPCDPRYTTLAVRQNSCFRVFLAVFVAYSPGFSGPGRISMASDPRYTTQAVPSKLVFSGISGRFRGLKSMAFTGAEACTSSYVVISLSHDVIFVVIMSFVSCNSPRLVP